MKVYESENVVPKLCVQDKIEEMVRDIRLGQAFLLNDLVRELYGNKSGGTYYRNTQNALKNLGFKIIKRGSRVIVVKEVLTAYENPTKSKEIG